MSEDATTALTKLVPYSNTVRGLCGVIRETFYKDNLTDCIKNLDVIEHLMTKLNGELETVRDEVIEKLMGD